jgi:hypothetical protein
MIDYSSISELLLRRFSLFAHNGYKFENGRLFLPGEILDKKLTIQSLDFVVIEQGLDLVIWYEFPRKSSGEMCKIAEKRMNEILDQHCLKSKFHFQSKGERKFIAMYLRFPLPQEAIEGDSITTNIAGRIIQDFLDDFVGYSAIWEGEGVTTYRSRCVIPLPDKKKYYYSDVGITQIGGKFIDIAEYLESGDLTGLF